MYIACAICVLFLCLICGTYAGQFEPGEQTIIKGETRTQQGSPVELSDARYTLSRSKALPTQFKLVDESVRVRNVSGRAIRRLYLRFIHRHESHSSDACGEATGISAVDLLAADETRDFTIDYFKYAWFAERNDLFLTVIPGGAEFRDGSHWAAPRNESCPLVSECLSSAESALRSRECSMAEDSYRILFEVTDPRITGYRLGIVKDMADSFQVLTGEWCELTDAQRVRGARFSDTGQSLGPRLILPREAHLSITPDGKLIRSLSGVAVFVAELRFADDRIWRRDTNRPALLWDN
jgi:hypothetical protein